jgi:hypothetical protein
MSPGVSRERTLKYSYSFGDRDLAQSLELPIFEADRLAPDDLRLLEKRLGRESAGPVDHFRQARLPLDDRIEAGVENLPPDLDQLAPALLGQLPHDSSVSANASADNPPAKKSASLNRSPGRNSIGPS